jgi:hypothetical protein
MNFYTIDPGYDAEAIEADEWTNQAPEPKIMEWKVQPFNILCIYLAVETFNKLESAQEYSIC